jgi:hypothetical protein
VISLIGLVVLLSLLLSCSGVQSDLAGSVTEGGNVVGLLINDNGSFGQDVEVQLISADYNPVADGPIPPERRDTTEVHGGYWFKRVGVGEYNVYARHLNSQSCALVTGIAVNGDAAQVATRTILKPGAIRVQLPLGAGMQKGFVYIPGTPLKAALPVDGVAAVIQDVPAGVVPFINYTDNTGSATQVIRYNVEVRSNDTTVVALPAWPFSRSVNLNTSAAGAGMTSDQLSVAVVVRLDSANFDFSQARPDGADLRFTNASGAPLPCAVERWDVTGKRAEVWVSIDTLRPDGALQQIVMYWGNPAAKAVTDAEVFDTSRGYATVWHLAEGASAAIGNFHDATATGLHLTGGGTSPAVAGVIGLARGFSAADDFLQGVTLPACFQGNASFTVSFWVNGCPVDTPNVQTRRVDLLDFGRKNTAKTAFHYLLWPDSTAQFGFEDPTISDGGRPDSNIAIAQNIFRYAPYVDTWTQVTTVYDANAGLLSTYLNGSRVDQDSVSGVQIDVAGGVRIGLPYNGNEQKFKGVLDEIRMYRGALAQKRVKLEYELQRPDSKVISILP